jgi:hypothetical protein
MPKLVLAVRDAFPARGGRVEVLPAVASDRLPASPFLVTVRTPDGAERRTQATAKLAHIRGPLPPLAMLTLDDVTADSLPPGTEIWVD